MISNARKYRAIENEKKNDEDLAHISKRMLEEINGVMTHKCK